jgi:hypothetical protein
MFRIAMLLLLLSATGCATRTVDAERFHSLTQRRGLGHLYYTGTNGEFHYLAERYFLEPTHHYRVPVSAYTITNTFPKTSDRSLWIPWLVDLASGTEGFRGEQVRD